MSRKNPSPKSERILDVAEELFALHGYDGVTLRQIAKGAGVDVEAVRPALSAPRGAMDTALRHLDAAHGGGVGYLQHTLGFGPEAPEQLRANLLI